MLSPYMADLSNNNDHFDPVAYRKAGLVIIALKASEGAGFADPKHRGWALAAGQHHIAVVHYHFGRPDLNPDGAKEADWFLHVTDGLRGPHDYLVYDGERARGGGFGLDPLHCEEFDRRIQERTRFHTMLYASASELVNAEHALVGPNRRDWDANYSSQPDTHAPGHIVAIRQQSDGVVGPGPHSLPGVGQCDVNVLRGGFKQQVFANAAR